MLFSLYIGLARDMSGPSERRGQQHGEEFQEGDTVVYHPTGAQNISEGEIKRIITEPEAVGGRQTVRASEEDPRFVLLLV